MPAIAPTVKHVVEQSTIDAAGKVIRRYSVQFMVGDQGPYTITVPENEFNAKAVKDKMDAFAKEITALLPQG